MTIYLYNIHNPYTVWKLTYLQIYVARDIYFYTTSHYRAVSSDTRTEARRPITGAVFSRMLSSCLQIFEFTWLSESFPFLPFEPHAIL